MFLFHRDYSPVFGTVLVHLGSLLLDNTDTIFLCLKSKKLWNLTGMFLCIGARTKAHFSCSSLLWHLTFFSDHIPLNSLRDCQTQLCNNPNIPPLIMIPTALLVPTKNPSFSYQFLSQLCFAVEIYLGWINIKHLLCILPLLSLCLSSPPLVPPLPPTPVSNWSSLPFPFSLSQSDWKEQLSRFWQNLLPSATETAAAADLKDFW